MYEQTKLPNYTFTSRVKNTYKQMHSAIFKPCIDLMYLIHPPPAKLAQISLLDEGSDRDDRPGGLPVEGHGQVKVRPIVNADRCGNTSHTSKDSQTCARRYGSKATIINETETSSAWLSQ
jgi:hypothetical protein